MEERLWNGGAIERTDRVAERRMDARPVAGVAELEVVGEDLRGSELHAAGDGYGDERQQGDRGSDSGRAHVCFKSANDS